MDIRISMQSQYPMYDCCVRRFDCCVTIVYFRVYSMESIIFIYHEYLVEGGGGIDPGFRTYSLNACLGGETQATPHPGALRVPKGPTTPVGKRE
jgi:hypothetical protein